VACIDLKPFEQFGQWRGSAFWQQGGHSRRCLAIKVSKYFHDDRGAFNTGDDVHGCINAVGAGMRRNGDPDITTALIASFDIPQGTLS